MLDTLSEILSKTKDLNHPCSVCQTKEGAVLGGLQYALFDDSPLANTFDVVCCAQCGFVFCDSPSSQDDYDSFYEKSFYSTAYLDREITEDEKKYVALISAVLSRYLDDKNARIFDIGCGTARLLASLSAAGYQNLYGIDPSASCVDLLNRHKGIQAAIGSLTRLPFNHVSADLIIVSHIMEHVIDLPVALQNIDDKLSKEGLVYVEVPDASKYGDMKGFSPLRFFYLQHVIHFDQSQLCNLFLSQGYQAIEVGHHIRIEGELLMPCVWGIFRKNNVRSVAVEPNFSLARQIKTWFHSASLDEAHLFADLAASDAPVYVWGMGTHIQMLLAMSPLKNCNIKCLIDQDERTVGKTIQGKKVDALDLLFEATEKEVVVIAAPTHSEKMYDYLINTVGFTGRVIVCGFGNVSLKS